MEKVHLYESVGWIGRGGKLGERGRGGYYIQPKMLEMHGLVLKFWGID